MKQICLMVWQGKLILQHLAGMQGSGACYKWVSTVKNIQQYKLSNDKKMNFFF